MDCPGASTEPHRVRGQDGLPGSVRRALRARAPGAAARHDAALRPSVDVAGERGRTVRRAVALVPRARRSPTQVTAPGRGDSARATQTFATLSARDDVPVDSPLVLGRDAKRGADEAVALGLREQLEKTRAVRVRLEPDVEPAERLDQAVAAVVLALRDDPARRPASEDRDPCAFRVEAETLEHAAHEACEKEVLRRPGVRELDRDAVLGPAAPVRVDRDGVLEALRSRRHTRIVSGRAR